MKPTENQRAAICGFSCVLGALTVLLAFGLQGMYGFGAGILVVVAAQLAMAWALDLWD